MKRAFTLLVLLWTQHGRVYAQKDVHSAVELAEALQDPSVGWVQLSAGLELSAVEAVVSRDVLITANSWTITLDLAHGAGLSVSVRWAG